MALASDSLSGSFFVVEAFAVLLLTSFDIPVRGQSGSLRDKSVVELLVLRLQKC